MEKKTETEIGILQPTDSKRVAEALLAKIEDADFNIAFAVGCELEHALNRGLNYKGVGYGLGEGILDQIDTTLNRVVEGCLWSDKMHRTIGDAIREGVEKR